MLIINPSGAINKFDISTSLGGQPRIISTKLPDCALMKAVGMRVCLQVEATGAPELNYTWSHNGKIIQKANTNVLGFTHVQADNGGEYTCRVENEFGIATSKPIQLKVGKYAATEDGITFIDDRYVIMYTSYQTVILPVLLTMHP